MPTLIEPPPTHARDHTTSGDSQPLASTRQARCCVVGGGPAGAILSLLLARAGVKVVLLEAHLDFDRDFRGDTVHPSTLEVLDQLDLAERLHALPHGKLRKLALHTPQGVVTIADLGQLCSKYQYVMTLPQARLLELLTEEAKKFPHFELVLGANVQRLVEEDGVVRGVQFRDNASHWHEVRADLTIGADGRFSKLRSLAGIEMIKTAPPMDVVWFRLPKSPADPGEGAEIHVSHGHFAVLLDRGDEWQIGYVILKGTFGALKSAGMDHLRLGLADAVPWLADCTHLLQDWKQVAVLNVESSRAPKWHKPGLLLIGDAAHVMSPVAGVGINVAVQDAVEAANLLAYKLRDGLVTAADLAAVQRQREFPVKVIQQIQRVIQDRIAGPGLQAGKPFRLPWFVRLITSTPGLRTLPARVFAYGPRRVRVDERILQE